MKRFTILLLVGAAARAAGPAATAARAAGQPRPLPSPAR
jgi:hypothetical protein